MKMVRYDQERIEKGESVLLTDSVLYKALQYSYEDFSKKDSPDPLNVFQTFEMMKAVFTLTQIALVVGMITILVVVFREFSSSDGKFQLSTYTAILFPLLGCLVISFMLILFVKQFYKPLFVQQAYEKIKESQTKLNNVHTKMTNAISPASDAEFYSWLTSETLDSLHSKIIEDSPGATALTKRLVTLSLRDYFMKEVPDYSNSPVRNLFTSDPSRRITNPGIYIRIDCTQLVQNYAYKYDDVLREINKNSNAQSILANVSTAISDINQAITDFRLNAEPTLTLVETYFRSSTLYLFFVVFLTLAIVIAWYNLGCPLGKGVAYVKFAVLWLWAQIKYLFKKKDTQPSKEDFIVTLKTNLDNVVKPPCRTKVETPIQKQLSETSGIFNKVKLLMKGAPPAPPAQNS
jgi:uncharacterized membrane protein YciS (DUF1049 family)